MDNTQKFTGKAEVYSCGRPHYAEGLFEVLAEDFGFKGREIATLAAERASVPRGFYRTAALSTA